jgi:hypothetical protein
MSENLTQKLAESVNKKQETVNLDITAFQKELGDAICEILGDIVPSNMMTRLFHAHGMIFTKYFNPAVFKQIQEAKAAQKSALPTEAQLKEAKLNAIVDEIANEPTNLSIEESKLLDVLEVK